MKLKAENWPCSPLENSPLLRLLLRGLRGPKISGQVFLKKIIHISKYWNENLHGVHTTSSVRKPLKVDNFLSSKINGTLHRVFRVANNGNFNFLSFAYFILLVFSKWIQRRLTWSLFPLTKPVSPFTSFYFQLSILNLKK